MLTWERGGVDKSVLRYVYAKWMAPDKFCRIFFMHCYGQVHLSITASKENVVVFFHHNYDYFIRDMVKHKLRVENLKARVKIQKCEFKLTSYEFKSTSYEFKSMSYEFKPTSYEFKSTSSRIIKSMKTQVNSLQFFTRN